MANYFSKYQGRGGPAIAPGIVQMMGSIGDEYAKGIEGLAEGIEKYRKNKREKESAQAIFEDLRFREDPDIVNFAVDPKRMTRIDEGKGTTEDFLVAANSIGAKIEDIEKFKKQDADEQDRQADRDYRSATLAQGDERITLAKNEQTARMIKEQAEKAQDQANLASFRALHSDEDTFDEEQYAASARAVFRATKGVAGGGDLDKFLNMPTEEAIAKFRRPQSPLEKANAALAVEGISTEQAGHISNYLQKETGEKLVYETDPVTGQRFVKSPATGRFEPIFSGGERPMSEGDKGRLERAAKSKTDKREDAEKDYRKLEEDIGELTAKIATQEDDFADQAIINANKARLSVKKRHKEELRKKLGLPAASTSTPTGGDERDYDYEFIDGEVR